MRIRRFTARDMTEALKLVRETLGPEAVILETGDLEGSRGARGGVMVLAAVDRNLSDQPESNLEFNRRQSPLRTDPVLASPANRQSQPVKFEVVDKAGKPSAERRPKKISQPVIELAPKSSPVAKLAKTTRLENTTPISSDPELDKLIGAVRQERNKAAARRNPDNESKLRSEIDQLNNRVAYLNRLISSDHFSNIPIPLRELYLDLVEAELDSNLTYALLQGAAKSKKGDLISGPQIAPLKKRLIEMLPAQKGILEQAGEQVVMLVGSPGSGKTTVATAMAARALRQGRRPGLISLDTFRAGGPAGLEHFAQILELPFAAVFDRQDLQTAAKTALAGCDILIIDTPGMLSGDAEAISMVEDLQSRLVGPNVHLVMSASSKVKDLAEGVAFFSSFNPKALIFSKLDTTQNYGGILSISLKARLPVTYLNWGRQFFEDFRTAHPEDVVDLVFDRCAVTHWSGNEAVSEAEYRRSAKETV